MCVRVRESQPSNGENHGTIYAFSKENKMNIKERAMNIIN